MNIWRVLGLEPTRDLAAIRRAYAAAARRYHPEEQPEEFRRVRAAYEQALAYARSSPREEGTDREGPSPAPAWEKYRDLENKSVPKKGVATGGTYLGPVRRGDRSLRPGQSDGPRRPRRPRPSGSADPSDALGPLSGGGRPPEPDWLREETAEGRTELFRRHPAMTEFRELWRQEKKRADRKTWREYFSSPAFLAVQREEGFTAALLEFIQGEVKGGQQPPLKFLTELSIVYGIRFRGGQTSLLSFAAFAGVDSIRRILALGFLPVLGPLLDHFPHEEDKIWAACWRDYFELLALAKNGGFADPRRARRWKELFDRYRKEKVTSRPEVTRKKEEEVEYRHPYGLRLLTALVKNHPLPPEAAQYLYDTLQLEAAAAGSLRQHYRPLLDALLPVLPDQRPVREEREALTAVKNAVENFLRRFPRRVSFPHTHVLPAYELDSSPQERQAAQALLEMPELQRLLFTGRLEESGVLDRIFSAPTALADALVHRVKDRPDDPAAKAVIARYLERSCKWLHDPELFYDRPYPFVEVGADPERITLDNWEFWHYYLSTAFPAAFSTEGEEFIGKLMGELYHPSLWWRRVFTGFNERAQRVIAPRSRAFPLGEHRVKVEFHFHYQIFWVDDAETAEEFPWEEFLSLVGEDPLLFWLALPLATGRDEDRPAIRREIAARIRAWDIYAANAGRLTDCLVNHIVTPRREGPSAGGYREDGRALYGCRVREDLTLEVYRVTGILRRREKLWDRPFASAEIAETAAEQYIAALLTPPLLRLERRPVAGDTPLQKARALADCLGEGLYTWEDSRRDEERKPALATEDFLDYGARHHGGYTADFYRKYLRHPYRAGVRFGSQEGERFLLEFSLEIWPCGSDLPKREPRGEMLAQLGMMGEPAYFIGALRRGETRYTLISNSRRKLLFALREGSSRVHSGQDLAGLLAGLLTHEEWDAVEFVERYEKTGGPGDAGG